MTSANSNSLYCPRCRYVVSWPLQLDDAGKVEIGAVGDKSKIEAIKRLREQFGIPLVEAKALVSHLSWNDGSCVRCSNKVPPGESVCSNCNAANLNW